MSNTEETRWQQRFENFQKILAKLEAACKKDTYSDLEQAGLMRYFIFSHELSMNALKDLLFYEGYGTATPRSAIRQAHQAGYLSETDAEIWLEALNKRNQLSHTYNEAMAREAVSLICNSYFPMLVRVRNTLQQKQLAT